MAGGWGSCRFGYYGQIQNIILEDLGYNVDFCLLDHPSLWYSSFYKSPANYGRGRVSTPELSK